MANKDFTITRPSPLIEEPAQIKFALFDIRELAASIKALSDEIVEGDKSGYLNISVGHLATKIGWIADRCCGFEHSHPDEWFMSRAFDNEADKAETEQEVTE